MFQRIHSGFHLPKQADTKNVSDGQTVTESDRQKWPLYVSWLKLESYKFFSLYTKAIHFKLCYIYLKTCIKSIQRYSLFYLSAFTNKLQTLMSQHSKIIYFKIPNSATQKTKVTNFTCQTQKLIHIKQSQENGVHSLMR